MASKTNMNLTYKTFPDVDFSAIKFDGIRAGKNGMKFASLVGGNGRRLVAETPAMRIPWNTEIRKSEETGQCSSKIALSFQGMSDDQADDGKLRRFFNFLNGVDERVKELAVQNKSELWQKAMDEGKIEAYFQSSVKASTNDKYPPTFQGKIPLQEGKNPSSEDVNEAMDMKIVVFRKDKTPVSPKELKGGCLASVIAEASYVWCTPMMIGISWIVKFVLVEPKPSETEFQFTDMDEFADIKDSPCGNKRKRDADDNDDDADFENEDENENKDEDEDLTEDEDDEEEEFK
ncbi:unnamed protein product [Ectocarpus sp. 4 AP-2014]|uniref:EsV-1-76 n=1 Tax=Ectocarpus siliculosus virus 1 (isolate New Zealand/Kaikoura/1988) TaxID=654926 RepID=Q8QNJ7_ESV1K|nr:EsV-1-76 [Ectocarpus siliculosus virus 1]AAK14499.1 EsV-1-76 [Ectocarpus siliculosus virus 1]